jgi:hypothetical protein
MWEIRTLGLTWRGLRAPQGLRPVQGQIGDARLVDSSHISRTFSLIAVALEAASSSIASQYIRRAYSCSVTCIRSQDSQNFALVLLVLRKT